MDLKQKVIEERISSLEELTADERAIARADAEVLALISENRRLGVPAAGIGDLPEKSWMLENAYRRADQYKEKPMTLISRMLAGRPLVARAAVVTVLLMLVAVASVLMLPRGTSWAAVNGYVLLFDFGQIGSGSDVAVDEQDFEGRVDLLNKAVQGWAEEQQAERAGESAEQEYKIFLNVEVDNGNLKAAVGIVDGTPELLDSLKAALAENKDLPEPTVTDSTWFTDKYGNPCEGSGLVVSIFNHRFEFPQGTASQTAEQQINAWLADNKPELRAQVEITDEDGCLKVEIRLVED